MALKVGEFLTTIFYKHWPISVVVNYAYRKGTTPAMGDDPNYVKLLQVTDGTGKNVLDKIPAETRKSLYELARERVFYAD